MIFRTPFQRLILWASTQAAMTAALAPLFHNDPTMEGFLGFGVGLLSGLPAYFYFVRRTTGSYPS